MQFLGHVVRFIVAALVLMVVGWIVPNSPSADSEAPCCLHSLSP